MFGEIIGAWLVDAWRLAGAPAPVRLVELGPGRGTLMADILRVARASPGFPRSAAPCISSRRARCCGRGRRRRWRGAGVAMRMARIVSRSCRTARSSSSPTSSSTRCRSASSCGPTANGASASSASTRMAALRLRHRRRAGSPDGPAAPDGAILEVAPAAECAGGGDRAAHRRAMAAPRSSSTTATPRPASATRCRRCARHAFADPLAAPGEADLTAHVDFAALARAARGGRRALRMARSPQGEFLLALGLLRARRHGSRRASDARDARQLRRRASSASPGRTRWARCSRCWPSPGADHAAAAA